MGCEANDCCVLWVNPTEAVQNQRSKTVLSSKVAKEVLRCKGNISSGTRSPETISRMFVPISVPLMKESTTFVHCSWKLMHRSVASRCSTAHHPVSRAWVVLMSLANLQESLSLSKIANGATGATGPGPFRNQTILPELSRLKT